MDSFQIPIGGVYLIFFVCATLFSVLVNGLFLKFAKTLGMRHLKENLIRWGPTTKPSLGGLSFYIIFLFSFSVLVVYGASDQDVLTTELVGLLLAITLGFLVGLADDAYDTNPLLKAFAQFTCANILITMGIYIEISSSMPINYFFTTLWVIGIMNSINMLDNMDGISTLVSITVIGAALLAVLYNKDYENVYLFILLGTLGALLGFLYYNWNPSRMYMGDTGSQFLGVFLAAVGIIFFWSFREPGGGEVQIRQFLPPLLIFTVPFLDTGTVVIRRMWRGQSPFVGGKDHITHHLVYLGIHERVVALILLGISVLSGLIFLWMLSAETWSLGHSLGVIGYFLAIFVGMNLLYERANKNVRDGILDVDEEDI